MLLVERVVKCLREEKRLASYQKVRCLDSDKGQKIWLVLHKVTGELRVLKKIGDDEKAIEGLRLWVSLNHPGLLRIYDIFQEKTDLYCIMEHVPGKTLREYVIDCREKRKRISVCQVVTWGMELCRILEHLHSNTPAIIYQDLKPSNIIISPEGSLKLIDPDSVSVTGERGRIVGTPGFLAPEQQTEEGILDEQTDIYALGCLLNWMIEDVSKSMLDGGFYLRWIILRCRMREKKRRYRTCRDLEKSLGRIRTVRNCLCILCVSVLLCMGGIGYSGYLSWQKSNREKTYQYYLNQGNISDYQSAIFLFPVREEGYQTLLDYIIKDGELDREEHRQLIFVLHETEQEFRENRKAYIKFSYRLGMVYWFQYAGRDAKAQAEIWLEKYLENLDKMKEEGENDHTEDYGNAVRAEVFCAIAGYRRILEKKETSQENVADYREIWMESDGLLHRSLKEDDSLITALDFWNETAGFFYQSREAFRKAGVTEEEWCQQIAYLKEKLQQAEIEKELQADGEKLKEELRGKLDLLYEIAGE